MNEIFLMNQSKFKISPTVEIYDKKSIDNCRNFYDVKARMISKLSKISISNL